MTFMLSRPGDVSDWHELSDISSWFGRPLDDATDEEKAKALAAVGEVVKRVEGIAIKVRVLEHRDYLNVCVGGSNDDTPQLDRFLASHDLDQRAIRLGLADIRGVSMEVVDDGLPEALASSQLAWLVAGAIRVLHKVPASEVPGFFTRAPVV